MAQVGWLVRWYYCSISAQRSDSASLSPAVLQNEWIYCCNNCSNSACVSLYSVLYNCEVLSAQMQNKNKYSNTCEWFKSLFNELTTVSQINQNWSLVVQMHSNTSIQWSLTCEVSSWAAEVIQWTVSIAPKIKNKKMELDLQFSLYNCYS